MTAGDGCVKRRFSDVTSSGASGAKGRALGLSHLTCVIGRWSWVFSVVVYVNVSYNTCSLPIRYKDCDMNRLPDFVSNVRDI